MTIEPIHTLGYRFSSTSTETWTGEGDLDTSDKIHNVANAVGYIPLIGTVVGLARMIFAISKYATSKSLSEAEDEYIGNEFCRGAVEFLSLGVSFAIPDLIITVISPQHPTTLGYLRGHRLNEPWEYLHNTANGMGYVPVLGSLVGLARIIYSIFRLIYPPDEFMEEDKKEAKEFYRAEIARGSFELLSIGMLLFIPDLIVTQARNKNLAL